MKAMLLSKKMLLSFINKTESRTIYLKQVEPKKKKLMVRLMLSSKDVCQKKMADAEECVHKED